MKTVDQMIDDILRREAGYINNPADKGGPTNFGITHTTLASYRGLASCSADDVRMMTKQEARTIYAQNYYFAPRINLLPAEIQPFVFDCAVNHGPTQAIRFVQQTVLLRDLRPLEVDGKLGPKTAERVRELLVNIGEEELLRALVERRRQFYLDLITRKPSQEVFRKGWMNRLAEFAVDDAQRTLILTGVSLPDLDAVISESTTPEAPAPKAPAPKAPAPKEPTKLVSFLNLLRDLLS
jgi:lysozyme family protein